MTKTGILLSAFVALAGLAVGCSDDGGTSAGSGSQTLLVQGSVEWNDELNGAEVHVSVQRAGAAVTDATVVVSSAAGDVTLAHEGGTLGSGADYVGVQTGWATSYSLRVVAGEDHLSGSITAPDLMSLVSPDTTVAIDAQAAPGGVITLRWSGDAADSIRVRSKDFDYEGTDEGHVDMPATMLKEDHQDLELRRHNSIGLAGGVAGSSLTARCENDFTLIVVNHY